VSIWQRIRQFFGADPFDVEERWDDSFPHMDDAELECPDTQPTSPGALDSDLGRLD
jgi:hypothetical protein